ncbi:phosphotransferase family protein [Ornithinibacillus californiensis]|uniref:phosphotransferase family protein n=1 Tax=Ornithinibacillus californiensis TaxID=161536 RepID=UPI00064DFC5A|nr:aminoglycoside phosphotransferase family protein [Ornithinibacillus californiensis]
MPIATGNTAKIYLHENQILKVFRDNFHESEAAYEASKQNIAYSSGLPVPKVIDVTKIDGKPALIMEYIKGKTLGDLLMLEKNNAAYYLEISIDIQRKIHEITTDSLEPISKKLIRQIQYVDRLNEQQKAYLLKKLDQMKFEPRLCHGDFHLYNLILTEDKQIVIIDWVDSSVGDIRADVYRTYLLYSQHSLELAELYLNLYCEKSGVSREDIFEWAPIIAGARLAEIVPSENQGRLLQIVSSYYE